MHIYERRLRVRLRGTKDRQMDRGQGPAGRFPAQGSLGTWVNFQHFMNFDKYRCQTK